MPARALCRSAAVLPKGVFFSCFCSLSVGERNCKYAAVSEPAAFRAESQNDNRSCAVEKRRDARFVCVPSVMRSMAPGAVPPDRVRPLGMRGGLGEDE